jgi:hypothetical protein
MYLPLEEEEEIRHSYDVNLHMSISLLIISNITHVPFSVAVPYDVPQYLTIDLIIVCTSNIFSLLLNMAMLHPVIKKTHTDTHGYSCTINHHNNQHKQSREYPQVVNK